MSTSSPTRRFSIVRAFSKSSKLEPTSSTTVVADFLTNAKAAFLRDVKETPEKAKQWTIVMGNEAGDLDSIASSIAYAWFLSSAQKQLAVPLIQISREDFSLRAENLYALGLAGIQDPEQQLLSNSDVAGLNPFPTDTFALVDHNKLGPPFAPTAKVVAIVDHHEDEGLYKDTAATRLIKSCGSCASLVASLLPAEIPAELATLLLTAIVIDTSGLKPGGKATDEDRAAASSLAPKSTLPVSLPSTSDFSSSLHDVPAIKTLSKELSSRKTDLSHMSGWDLLRRDYKEYTHTLSWATGEPTIKAGLATVPVQLKSWGSKGRLETDSVAWMKTRGLVVLGVLTTFRDEKKMGKGKGTHKREMAWIVLDEEHLSEEHRVNGGKVDTEALASRLWKGLEKDKELQLKASKKFKLEKGGKLPPNTKAKVYKQKNANATRKVVAPLVKTILEGTDSKPSSSKL